MKFEIDIEDESLFTSLVSNYEGSQSSLVLLLLNKLNICSSKKEKIMSILQEDCCKTEDVEQQNFFQPILQNGDNNPLRDFFVDYCMIKDAQL